MLVDLHNRITDFKKSGPDSMFTWTNSEEDRCWFGSTLPITSPVTTKVWALSNLVFSRQELRHVIVES